MDGDRTLPSPSPSLPRARFEAVSDLPTRYGHFRIHVFTDERTGREHIAMVKGEVWGEADVPMRIHSECMTGDVMGSLRCDCREQLERALSHVGGQDRGVVLYLRQEGRGIGLANKIKAYRLQQELGLDTVDANLALGFKDDERDYGIAVSMLRTLGVRSVRLMTNNPDKVRQLVALGMPVSERMEHLIPPGAHNRGYLETKAKRSGHIIPFAKAEPEPAEPAEAG